MGKGELSKLDPFQMVILFMIAELAAIPIESLDISLLNGATAIITLLFLEVVISILSLKSQKLNNFFNGKPSLIIEQGKINSDELKSLRITIDDLTEQLRLKNFPSISDVDYAILESNGDLSVIPKSDKAPLTKKDLNASPSKTFMPMVLLSDGVLFQKNLRMLGKNENYLKKELLKYKIKDYSEVFLCFFDENKQLHVYINDRNNSGLIKEAKQK
jgi:Predicted membrane protein